MKAKIVPKNINIRYKIVNVTVSANPKKHKMENINMGTYKLYS